MKLGLVPFYSQQHKKERKFLLSTCAASKHFAYIAKRHGNAFAVVPRAEQTLGGNPFPCETREQWLPLENPLQRVHWDVWTLRLLLSDADAILTSSEYLAVPLRSLFPKTRIVQMCVVVPEPLRLFQEAWECADLVVTLGESFAERIRTLTSTPVQAWRFGYDADEYQRCSGPRSGALFVTRSSATNYTHHEEFLEAATGLNVEYTDVTGYLRLKLPDLRFCQDYRSALNTSKVAVALHNDEYGGSAIREAVACGCVPVTLRTPAYESLLGADWPCFAEDATPAEIRAAVLRGLSYDGPLPDVSGDSYQSAWEVARAHLSD